jgi:hypothetical protein
LRDDPIRRLEAFHSDLTTQQQPISKHEKDKTQPLKKRENTKQRTQEWFEQQQQPYTHSGMFDRATSVWKSCYSSGSGTTKSSMLLESLQNAIWLEV